MFASKPFYLLTLRIFTLSQFINSAMWNPDRFAQAISKAPEWLDLFTPKLESIPWRENDSVLDYGCGQGRRTKMFFLSRAIETNSTIFGMDRSEGMIESAKKVNSDPHIIYKVGDLMEEGKSPFVELKFDKIFCFYVLHWIKDYRQLLKRFYEIQQPGGYTCLFFVSDCVMFRMLEEIAQNPKWAGYMKGHEEFLPEWIEKDQNILDEIKQSCTEIGYKIVNLETNNDGRNSVKMEFETYTEICVALNPFLSEIEPALYEDLTIDYAVILKKMKPWDVETKDGMVDFKMEVVFAILQKPEDR